jgi:hypothetical protein
MYRIYCERTCNIAVLPLLLTLLYVLGLFRTLRVLLRVVKEEECTRRDAVVLGMI